MFGERLRLARKRSGLSLRALSSEIGGIVSAQAIGKYERGEMMPSSDVAIALADALDVLLSYLLSPSSVSLKSVEFRKLASTSAKERATVEAETLDYVDRYLQIEEILGIDTSDWERPNVAPYRVNALEDAEDAAAAVRAAWNLGSDPIPNMVELLEERGVKALKLSLPERVDGLGCQVARAQGADVPVVVFSSVKSNERQRFTLAHELGHFLLDAAPDVQEEKACNRFAGAFLAPSEELLREAGRRRRSFGLAELIEIKRIFGISAAALVVRMRDLGIISETALRNIFRGVGRGWRKIEPCPIERTENPTRFRRLCLRALAESEISESKAAELLRMPVGEIERVMTG